MWFGDRMVNLVSALGSQKDKTTHGRHIFVPLDRQQILAAYRQDWIARKVVDIPAFDMAREGRNWQADEGQIEALENEETRLQLWPKLSKALKLARLTGGSVMIMGTGDANPALPLNIDGIGQGGLKFLHVVDRWRITAGVLDRDPSSETWGQPKSYTLAGTNGEQTKIDASRVVQFIGNEVPDPLLETGWGDSVLEVLDEAVKNAGLTTSGIAALVTEAKIDVFGIPKLMENVADERYRQKVLDRISLANQAKSITNGLLMDAEETYNQKQINFAGLTDVLEIYLQIASGAADIPATRLIGQSPKGMSATGESDMRNYYDRLSADQELTLRPRLSRLDEVLIRSALGARPPEVWYSFAPLWQMSDTEKATIFASKATAARALAGTGGTSPALLPIDALSDALVNTFTEDGSLTGLQAAIDEYGKLSEQPDETEEAAAALPPAPADPAEDPPAT